MEPIKIVLYLPIILALNLISMIAVSQLPLEANDPLPKNDIPDFYKSRLSDIESEIANLTLGKSVRLTESAGGLPLYAIYYGEKDDFQSRANYNSAVGARNPAWYAKKTTGTKPVIYFIGPVHGQEGEGIAGLVNLIHVAETGKDHRGRKWTQLNEFIHQCRVIIIPCGNPDGRKRSPYDSFVGLPVETMTKYGQGTKKDGTLWRWPHVKSQHPMQDDVNILGAYFNDDGVNIMHDEFFFPMAEETKAIMKVARDEAPDIAVSLHSCSCRPFIIQNNHAPLFIRQRLVELAGQLNRRYIQMDLPHMPDDWELDLNVDEKSTLPTRSFNLSSALHHVSGAMAFTFESPHGTLESPATYDEIVDIQLILYEEMFRYILDNRIYWE